MAPGKCYRPRAQGESLRKRVPLAHQNGYLSMQEARSNEHLKDAIEKEKVVMYADEAAKRPKPMRFESQGKQGV